MPNDPRTQMQPDPLGYDASVLRRRPHLRWTDAAGPHAMVLEGRVVVGSAAGLDVVVTDPAVSRLHAELDPQESGVWVRDAGSRNGTFVEGVRVTGACVPDGGRVRIGSTTLTVHYDPTPTAVPLWPSDRFGPLLGASVPMRELFARLAKIAATDATVLIQGETGTGKELVAQALHEHSPRGDKPLVVVDCAALPESLLEAELFGHARGAFTGAVEARAGAIEAAEGGTVFLDEIGELPLAMQPKLLRVLESRTVRRIGETSARKVDVRILSATHRDLRQMVNARAFREDLYFRLAVVPVTIPPLRDRLADVPALVQHFLPAGSPAPSPELLRELANRPWLGNVRELRNFVERARALGAQEALAMEQAGGAPGSAGASAGIVLPEALFELPFKDAREQVLAQLEREYIERLLARHGGNVSAVAQTAGLYRTYVHRLIRRHDL